MPQVPSLAIPVPVLLEITKDFEYLGQVCCWSGTAAWCRPRWRCARWAAANAWSWGGWLPQVVSFAMELPLPAAGPALRPQGPYPRHPYPRPAGDHRGHRLRVCLLVGDRSLVLANQPTNYYCVHLTTYCTALRCPRSPGSLSPRRTCWRSPRSPPLSTSVRSAPSGMPLCWAPRPPSGICWPS
jgi:hypothetical protein